MELKGTLDEHKVPDLLQALAALAQSGVLQLWERSGAHAEVGLERGIPRWCRCQHLDGEEALLACLFWREGHYQLEASGGAASGGNFPANWQLPHFLLRAMYVVDELEKRRSLVPAPETPLSLSSAEKVEDAFGCGLDKVLDALHTSPGITPSKLEQTLPLAPVKIRLALALLVENRILNVSLPPPAADSSDRHSLWWSRLVAKFGGGLRVAILGNRTDHREVFFELVSVVSRKLKVQSPWVSFSSTGPSFARFQPPAGGVLSVCWLPQGSEECFSLAATQDLVVSVGGDTSCGDKLKVLGIPVRSIGSGEQLAKQFLQLLEEEGIARDGDARV